jgi:hypothetical protein
MQHPKSGIRKSSAFVLRRDDAKWKTRIPRIGTNYCCATKHQPSLNRSLSDDASNEHPEPARWAKIGENWCNSCLASELTRLGILVVLICCSNPFLGLAAETNSDSDVPTSSLHPPRGEILPSFWEENGTLVILGGICLLAVIALCVWLFTRPKPPVIVPFAVVARKELEALRPQPENGLLLSRASQILRHYIGAVFGWPAGELTTAEFSHGLLSDPKVGPELAGEASKFLRACDIRKFAPLPPSTPDGVIAQAMRIIDLTESRLTELNRSAVAAVPDTNLKSPSQMDQRGRMASGA